MLPVLIGSRALNFWLGKESNPKADWDVISDYHIKDTEWHDPKILYNSFFAIQYNSHQTIMHPNGTMLCVMNMLGLAIIKRSHLHRDLSFQKHITSYHKSGLAKILEHNKKLSDMPMYDLSIRTRLTKEMFPQGNPNLMQSKKDFFNDAVHKFYEHDYLHELFAYGDAPVYKKLLRQDDLAWCEKNKWDQLSFDEKCMAVSEEAMVIATERFIVPKFWKYSAKLAYIQSVDKICTTLCSGWFRDFAIDNYPVIIDMFSVGKFDEVKNILLGVKND